MSNMTVLARDLLHIDAEPVVCFNNKRLLHISHYQTYNPGFNEFLDDCIYIVTDKEVASEQHLLTAPVNLLILGTAPHNMERHIGSETNVIFIDVKTRLSKLHASIQRCCNAFRVFSKYSEQMLQAVLQRDSLTEYISVCAEMFGQTVFLLQNNKLITVASANGVPDDNFDLSVVDHVTSKEYEWIPGAQNDISYPELVNADNDRCILVTSFCPDGHSAFKLCILSAGKISRGFEESDYPLSVRTVEMLVRIISSGTSFKNTQTFAQFFDRTISTTNQNRTMTISRAASLNFRPIGNTYMYMIYSESGTKLDFVDIIDRINRSTGGIVFPYHSRIILLSEEPTSSCIEKLRDILKKEKSDWRFVKSLLIDSAADLKRAYSECLNAQRISRYYSSDDIFIAYEHLSAPLMLLRYQELSDDITDLALPIAKTIIDYDVVNGTDYRTTLSLYIRTFKNIQITADTLHVHRNTIHFRLQKMSEIFGIDFDDYRLLHNIGFSLDVYESAGIYRELSM